MIDFKPEYLIVALGENVPELKMKEEQCAYRDAFLKLLKGFLSSNPAQIRRHISGSRSIQKAWLKKVRKKF